MLKGFRQFITRGNVLDLAVALVIGAAFGTGFILGPALGGLFSHISYTAPIWAAATLSAIAATLAFMWLPEPVKHMPASDAPPWWQTLPVLLGRHGLGRLLVIDLLYWFTFAVYQTTFALFGQRRFGWDATHIGYTLAAFGALAVVVQAGLVGQVTRAIGDRRVLVLGLLSASGGMAIAAAATAVPVFLIALVPGALGIALCSPTLISLISKAVIPTEQGLVQGAAGALESLGRTVGPICGNAMLEHFGEGAPYATASVIFAATAILAATATIAGVTTSAAETSAATGR